MASCAHCAASNAGNTFKCPDCPANGGVTQQFRVCDRECQKAFWKSHKKTHAPGRRDEEAPASGTRTYTPAGIRAPGETRPTPPTTNTTEPPLSDAQKAQLAERVFHSSRHFRAIYFLPHRSRGFSGCGWRLPTQKSTSRMPWRRWGFRARTWRRGLVHDVAQRLAPIVGPPGRLGRIVREGRRWAPLHGRTLHGATPSDTPWSAINAKKLHRRSALPLA